MAPTSSAGLSPEFLERVRIHRRLSLNPAVGGAMGRMQERMGPISAGMGLGGGINTNHMGMGSTGNYGEYRYLESGQGLGMLNRYEYGYGVESLLIQSQNLVIGF